MAGKVWGSPFHRHFNWSLSFLSGCSSFWRKASTISSSTFLPSLWHLENVCDGEGWTRHWGMRSKLLGVTGNFILLPFPHLSKLIFPAFYFPDIKYMKQYDWQKTLNSSSHMHQRPAHWISNCNHLHNCLLLTAKKQLQFSYILKRLLVLSNLASWLEETLLKGAPIQQVKWEHPSHLWWPKTNWNVGPRCGLIRIFWHLEPPVYSLS